MINGTSRTSRLKTLAIAAALSYAPQYLVAETLDVAVAYYQKEEFSKAFDIFLTLAKHQDAKAQFFVSAMYQSGKGVEQDEDKAFTWCKKAAEEGILEAQFQLGLMYLQGIGVTEDDDYALEWIWAASDRGHPQAKETLQFILESDFTTGC